MGPRTKRTYQWKLSTEDRRTLRERVLAARWKGARDFVGRFWAKVNTGKVDECWDWTASRSKGKWDYGKLRGRHNGPGLIASQVAWMLENERDIPIGMHVLHSCDRPRCCNPAHLSLGTLSENIRQCIERGRWFKPKAPGRQNKTRCNHGHDMTGKGMWYPAKKGGRRCATCSRERSKMYQRKRRSELVEVGRLCDTKVTRGKMTLWDIPIPPDTAAPEVQT